MLFRSELVVRHWYQNLLHNQRSNLLKLMLLLRGNQRILVINIPWYLDPNPGQIAAQQAKAHADIEKAKAAS